MIDSVASFLDRYLKSIRVHAGHDVYPGVVQQPPDVVVRVIVLDEVEDHVQR